MKVGICGTIINSAYSVTDFLLKDFNFRFRVLNYYYVKLFFSFFLCVFGEDRMFGKENLDFFVRKFIKDIWGKLIRKKGIWDKGKEKRRKGKKIKKELALSQEFSVRIQGVAVVWAIWLQPCSLHYAHSANYY